MKKLHEIADDIEVLVQFVERWNKNDEDREAAQAAANVEQWLATVQDEKEV